MRHLWVLLLVLTVVVTTACSSGSSVDTDDPEVKGVRAERTPESDAPTEMRTVRRTPTEPEATDAPEAETEPPAQQAAPEDEPDNGPVEQEPAQEPPADEPPAEEPPAEEPPAEEPPAEEESPDEEPSPEPTAPRMETRDGWSYVTWQPRDGSEDGEWWSEASGAPPITRDDPEARESEPLRVTLEAADGSTTADRVRDGACSAWIVAPDDHGWHVRGRVTVSLVAGSNTGLIIERHDLDTVVEPGQRLDLRPTTPQDVDAAEGRDITCRAKFDAR